MRAKRESRKPPVPMQPRSPQKRPAGANSKAQPTAMAPPAAAAAPVPPAAAAAAPIPPTPPPAIAIPTNPPAPPPPPPPPPQDDAQAQAPAETSISVSARREAVLSRFGQREAERTAAIQRQRASMQQEVAALRMGSPSPRSAARALSSSAAAPASTAASSPAVVGCGGGGATRTPASASANGGERRGGRGVGGEITCPSPAAEEIERARGSGAVQAMASQFTGPSSRIETREMAMHRRVQEEQTDRQARSAARELLAHFHGAHALFQGESHQAFLHRLQFESSAKEKALFLRAWARDRGLQGGPVSVAEGEQFLRDIGLLPSSSTSSSNNNSSNNGTTGVPAVPTRGAGVSGGGGRAASVASSASASSSSSAASGGGGGGGSGAQPAPQAAQQRNEEWMSLLARAVNDAATAPPEAGAAAGESNHSTTANHTNHTTTLGDDTENADLETVSSLSSASVAPLSVSSAPAPRRRLFGQSGPAVGVMEEEGEEDDDELGSYPSIETDVSLAPLLAGVAVGGGGQGQGAGSRSGSAATTGSVGSSASSKGAAGASSNGAGAEGWSTVSQDGNVEGNEDVANSVRVGVGVGASGVGEEGGEKPVGRESASWAVEEEGGEGEDEALRQLRDKGFWFSDKMASLLPSTPSPLRGAATSDLAPPAAVAAAAGQKMMGKAPQE